MAERTPAEAVHDVREGVAGLLAETPPESFACEHGDLGYGFGAWSSAFLRRLGEAGWIGLGWPAEVGGRGRGPAAVHELMRSLAGAGAPAEALLYTLAVGYCVYTFGSDALKARFLPPMLRGEITFAEALSEAGAGSDLLALRTTARRDGDEWVVNGSKLWTSNGWLADYALVAARTDPDAPRQRGISVLLVDLTGPGVDRRPILDMADEPSYSEIFFDDVRVPADHLVGEPGRGLQHILDALEWDRLWGRCVKGPFLRRELVRVVAWCQEADGGARWRDPVVRHELARLAVEIDVCDALFWRAVDTVEATGASATHEVSLAKIYADELGGRFYRAVQDVVGPYGGLVPSAPAAPLGGAMARGTLSAHGLLVAGGTPEIQRATIATRHLGLGAGR